MDSVKSIRQLYQNTMPEKIKVRNNQLRYFDQEAKKLMATWKKTPELKEKSSYKNLSDDSFYEKWGEYQ